jgi:hypothetical protein
MPIKSAYLAGILAHIPEAERGKVETEIETLEKDGLRQSDYSKKSDELQAEKTKFEGLYASNLDWFEQHKAALAETDTLRARVVELEKKPAPTTADLPKDLIRRSDLDGMERDAVGFIAASTRLGLEHFQNFGKVLDISALLADKRIQTLGLQGVYNETFKDDITAKATAAQTARDEAIREEARKEERAKLAATRTQYPVVGNETSALDGIEASRDGKAPAVRSVDEMAAEYARLGVTRTA